MQRQGVVPCSVATSLSDEKYTEILCICHDIYPKEKIYEGTTDGFGFGEGVRVWRRESTTANITSGHHYSPVS